MHVYLPAKVAKISKRETDEKQCTHNLKLTKKLKITK